MAKIAHYTSKKIDDTRDENQGLFNQVQDEIYNEISREVDHIYI